MNDVLNLLEKFSHALSRWLNWIAGVAAVGMLLLVVSDIIGVKLFKSPIPGAIEWVGYISVVMVSCAMAYTLVIHGHIQIDYFILQVPLRVRAGIKAVVNLLGCILFAILAWQSFAFGSLLQRTGEVSMTQRIAFYPFVYIIAVCSLAVCLVTFMDMIESVQKAVEK